MKRMQKELILKDLRKKIVFIVGPRQVGKTWLARDISAEFKNPVYLSYDNIEDKEIVKKSGWRENTDLLVLDELHKMPDWKNYLKGLYDTKPSTLSIIVTGSARLDTFRQGGDSLAGRFFAHRLMPFSPAELKGNKLGFDIERFIKRGGFPEPFLADEDSDADRWRMQYIDGLIRSDILDLGSVSDLKSITLLLELLRRRVGSPVSYTSLAEDIHIAPNTVKKYIEILEALYIVFRVLPFTENIARALQKMPKIYFYDTGLVSGDEGARFENFAAVCLLKNTLARTDSEGKNYGLSYLRTKDGLEVDFCLTLGDKPIQMIETKYSDNAFSKNLINFAEQLSIPAVQVVQVLRQERKESKAEMRKASDFFSELHL